MVICIDFYIEFFFVVVNDCKDNLELYVYVENIEGKYNFFDFKGNLIDI